MSVATIQRENSVREVEFATAYDTPPAERRLDLLPLLSAGMMVHHEDNRKAVEVIDYYPFVEVLALDLAGLQGHTLWMMGTGGIDEIAKDNLVYLRQIPTVELKPVLRAVSAAFLSAARALGSAPLEGIGERLTPDQTGVLCKGLKDKIENITLHSGSERAVRLFEQFHAAILECLAQVPLDRRKALEHLSTAADHLDSLLLRVIPNTPTHDEEGACALYDGNEPELTSAAAVHGAHSEHVKSAIAEKKVPTGNGFNGNSHSARRLFSFKSLVRIFGS